jgi:hypothetical protein
MYAMFAGTSTTLHKVTPITALPLKPHLTHYPTTGVAHCAALTKPIFQKHKMKNGIFILLFFIFFISLCAQETTFEPTEPEGLTEGKSNFRGGVRVGLNTSQITKDGFSFEGYNKLGAFVGLFANFPVSKSGKWLIQSELNFMMKGCKHVPKRDEFGNVFGNHYWLQLMYCEIPVVAKWKFYKGFEVETGTAFGVLLKNRNVEKVNGYYNIGLPPFYRFEFSGIIGLNYLFYKHFGASLRYEFSILPVRRKAASDYLYLTGGQHNQSFCFSAYYQF